MGHDIGAMVDCRYAAEAYVDTERIFVEDVEKRGMKVVDRTGIKQTEG